VGWVVEEGIKLSLFVIPTKEESLQLFFGRLLHLSFKVQSRYPLISFFAESSPLISISVQQKKDNRYYRAQSIQVQFFVFTSPQSIAPPPCVIQGSSRFLTGFFSILSGILIYSINEKRPSVS
jgi:hypothetical protein